ncbi:hypothetical protein WJ96_06005 [Burkholderia ubonensis]|uniref:Tyrosine specific protein phosphatases domain-containing protein n=1 Tax=Burkholderia ubonensis TaxID=101571 RepID=A0AAW3MXT1_9BURK|nr:hypothetical protein [Burkholderia ubonensis]KVP75310.1 hypothetical protein WJ93_07800 [Burkholderia ubonensis]KVP96778.1 hypothetical protein WJ97_12930 [Burkholderia ubonensis]KVP98123.1 hypothetical protein WJ96_06005 [Burkholderia ubonensis]KVZ92820.1 hypothetical protein WL25_17665 [Burkholderia ubonensis]
MQHIRFLPRAVAAGYRPAPGSVLISIHDRSEPPLTPMEGWADVLVQRFHDTDGDLMGLEVFSAAQARNLLAFVERNQDCTELVVHCSLGQSRSAAVAIYLSEKYGVPCYKEQVRVTWENWKVYNRLVYRRLHTADNEIEG